MSYFDGFVAPVPTANKDVYRRHAEETAEIFKTHGRCRSWSAGATSVHLDWLRRPSVTPSVRQLNDCGCHFWIKSGRIQWCSDSGPRPALTPRSRI